VVSHDLRSPLATILLRATALEHGLASGPADARARGAVDAMRRAAQRMSRLIEDLLDAARIEAEGRLPLRRSRQEPSALLAEAVDAMLPQAAAKSLRVARRVEPDLPALECDAGRILQVLSNLLGNALKFTPPGGAITVGAGRRGDEVVCFVADSGPGIPGEALPHLFDRFWRGDRTSREGAGLGLYISRGIVEAHGGRIWVHSSGAGTQFFFALPAAPQPGARPSDAPAPGPSP